MNYYCRLCASPLAPTAIMCHCGNIWEQPVPDLDETQIGATTWPRPTQTFMVRLTDAWDSIAPAKKASFFALASIVLTVIAVGGSHIPPRQIAVPPQIVQTEEGNVSPPISPPISPPMVLMRPPPPQPVVMTPTSVSGTPSNYSASESNDTSLFPRATGVSSTPPSSENTQTSYEKWSAADDKKRIETDHRVQLLSDERDLKAAEDHYETDIHMDADWTFEGDRQEISFRQERLNRHLSGDWLN